jgi:hypothetical protein
MERMPDTSNKKAVRRNPSCSRLDGPMAAVTVCTTITHAPMPAGSGGTFAGCLVGRSAALAVPGILGHGVPPRDCTQARLSMVPGNLCGDEFGSIGAPTLCNLSVDVGATAAGQSRRAFVPCSP